MSKSFEDTLTYKALTIAHCANMAAGTAAHKANNKIRKTTRPIKKFAKKHPEFTAIVVTSVGAAVVSAPAYIHLHNLETANQ